MPEIEGESLMLAMDTSGDVCSIAVLRNGLLRAEHTFRHDMHLSERVLAHVEAVLADADAEFEKVSHFAVGIGPGSFTGTRIGVMTMKCFSLLCDKPIIGIDGLSAMAAEYCGIADLIVTPVLLCRSGTVYACPFSVAGSAPVPLAEPAALTFEALGNLLRSLSDRDAKVRFLFCGPAAARYNENLRSVMGFEADIPAFGTVAFPRASVIGSLTMHRLEAGDGPGDALILVPLYISPPPITMPRIPIPAQ